MSWKPDDPECHGTGILDARGVEIVRVEQRLVLPIGFAINAPDPAPEEIAVMYAPADHLVELLGPPPRHPHPDSHDDDLVSHAWIAPDDEGWDDEDEEDDDE